jgi:hypothetical protein
MKSSNMTSSGNMSKAGGATAGKRKIRI